MQSDQESGADARDAAQVREGGSNDTGLADDGDTENVDVDLLTEDVDRRYATLVEQYESGDESAAHTLYELSRLCMSARRDLSEMREAIDGEPDPEVRQAKESRYDRLKAAQRRCRDSRYGNVVSAVQEYGNWGWRAAEAGYQDAMYDVVFNYRSGSTVPDDWEVAGNDADILNLRQRYASALRESCHAPSLQSMGRHMARGSRVADGLYLDAFEDFRDDRARQMEAFAHRYAAAQLNGHERPGHTAREADFALTAAEEMAAAELGTDILSACD